VFTLNRRRVTEICHEIGRRGLRFQWECLGRVDALDYPLAREMKQAGCARIFFGIESGNDRMLALMNKGITTQQARDAVEAARRAGLQVGAFFILFYPGDTDDTVIETLRFASSLPLDYLGLTRPYLLPGTALLERVTGQARAPSRSAFEGAFHGGGADVTLSGLTRQIGSRRDTSEGSGRPQPDASAQEMGLSMTGQAARPEDETHPASEAKVAFAILKGHAEFRLKRRLGKRTPSLLELFERSTDGLLRLMR
jgi:hypothetical protein